MKKKTIYIRSNWKEETFFSIPQASNKVVVETTGGLPPKTLGLRGRGGLLSGGL